MNTSYKSNELEYILNQSDSTTLVLMEEYRDTNFYKTTQEVIPELDTAKPGNWRTQITLSQECDLHR